MAVGDRSLSLSQARNRTFSLHLFRLICLLEAGGEDNRNSQTFFGSLFFSKLQGKMASEEEGHSSHYWGAKVSLTLPRYCILCEKYIWISSFGSAEKIAVECARCGESAHHACSTIKAKQKCWERGHLERASSPLRQLDTNDLIRSHPVSARSLSPSRGKSPFSRKETNPPSCRYLFVQVIAGKNLVVRDDTGFSDPYVVLLVNQQKQKTKILSQTLFPRWNEVFQFIVTDLEQECLSVTVMDWDRMARDDFMGQFVLSLKNLVLNEERAPEWYDLQVCALTASFSLSLTHLIFHSYTTTTHFSALFDVFCVNVQTSEYICPQARPGKAEEITGSIQLKIDYVSDATHAEKLRKKKRETLLEGPVTLRKGAKGEEKVFPFGQLHSVLLCKEEGRRAFGSH